MPGVVYKSTRTKYAEGYLREQLASGMWKSGDVLPASDELARLLGISKITLSNAMEPLVREGLLLRKTGVGTLVSDSISPNEQGIVIFTSTSYESINRPNSLISGDISYFETGLVRSIIKLLNAENRSYALVHPSVEHSTGFLDEPYITNKNRICGAIGMMDRFRCITSDSSLDFPFVAISPYVSETKNEVIIDLAISYKTGLDILKANGNKSILFMSYDYQASAGQTDKSQAVRDKLIANGISEFLRSNPNITDLPISYETIISGAPYYLLREYLENNPYPDALFIVDDTFIPGVYHALKDMNIEVGKDLKLLCISTKQRNYGFDLAWTRLEYDTESIAIAVVNILKECLNGDDSGIKQYAWPKLVMGNSL